MTSRWPIVALGALFTASATWGDDGQPLASIEVVTAVFGVYPTHLDGPSFRSSDVIPFVPSQVYGWGLVIRSQKKQRLVYREELTLPERPKTWAFGKWPEHSVSDDGRTAVRQEEIALDEGNNWVMTNWQMAYGDPKGTYEARIFLNGVLVGARSIPVQ